MAGGSYSTFAVLSATSGSSTLPGAHRARTAVRERLPYRPSPPHLPAPDTATARAAPFARRRARLACANGARPHPLPRPSRPQQRATTTPCGSTPRAPSRAQSPGATSPSHARAPSSATTRFARRSSGCLAAPPPLGPAVRTCAPRRPPAARTRLRTRSSTWMLSRSLSPMERAATALPARPAALASSERQARREPARGSAALRRREPARPAMRA